MLKQRNQESKDLRKYGRCRMAEGVLRRNYGNADLRKYGK